MPCVDMVLLAACRVGRHAVALPRALTGGAVLALSVALSVVLSACQTSPADKPPPDKTPPRVTAPPAGRPADATGPTAATPRRAEVRLPPPATPRSWKEARAQAARRLVAANPDATYMDKPPTLLLAIPVMTVDLNADGSVRNISVMRYPSQAKDTVNLAIQAIHRAAPYGDVSSLPKPWRFNETFLFNDDRKFKPMTLDLP